MKTGFYFTVDCRGWTDKRQRGTISASPLSAIEKANGNFCWYVDFTNKKKLIFLGCADVESLLRQFACECALDVIHLWKAPEIVVQYLQTKDENIRDAARDAAWDAARAAAWNAARDAAWDAARDAAWNAARAAARAAAWNAARAAAWDAARAAAWNAARDAAWDAAGDAAGDAAWDAAGDAAGDAARDAARGRYDAKLTEMLKLKFNNQETA